MTTNDSLSLLSDAELLIEVKRLAGNEREATADLIRSLAEVEARRLHLASGCSSMFTYCTQVLHLSEHAAYARIAAARAATRFPVVMDLLIEGAITLTTVTLLGRHLTDENHAALLDAARHKSKTEVEMLVATLHPQPDVPSSIRKLPAPKLAAATTAPLIADPTTDVPVAQSTTREQETAPPPQPVVVRAMAPERYKLQVTIGAETRAKLRRAQDLLRHTNRCADEAAVIDRALTVLVKQLEKVKYARTDRPRPADTSDPNSRYVPANLQRAVTRGTATDARSTDRRAAAPRPRASSSTTSAHLQRAARRPSTTWSCDALLTICTKPSGGSGCSCRRPATHGDCPPKCTARRRACPPKRAARRRKLGLDQVLWMECA